MTPIRDVRHSSVSAMPVCLWLYVRTRWVGVCARVYACLCLCACMLARTRLHLHLCICAHAKKGQSTDLQTRSRTAGAYQSAVCADSFATSSIQPGSILALYTGPDSMWERCHYRYHASSDGQPRKLRTEADFIAIDCGPNSGTIDSDTKLRHNYFVELGLFAAAPQTRCQASLAAA